MDAHLLDLALQAVRKSLGEKPSIYDPILQRIQAVQDGDTSQDPVRIAYDLGILQSQKQDFLDEGRIRVIQILLAVINILNLERRYGGSIPLAETRFFIETLRQVYPTRMELVNSFGD